MDDEDGNKRMAVAAKDDHAVYGGCAPCGITIAKLRSRGSVAKTIGLDPVERCLSRFESPRRGMKAHAALPWMDRTAKKGSVGEDAEVPGAVKRRTAKKRKTTSAKSQTWRLS